MPNGQELVDPLSLNLYAYCSNNPVMYMDPSGHFFIADDTVVILVLVAGTAIITTAAWLSSPDGQKVLREGAVAISNGVAIVVETTGNTVKGITDNLITEAKTKNTEGNKAEDKNDSKNDESKTRIKGNPSKS